MIFFGLGSNTDCSEIQRRFIERIKADSKSALRQTEISQRLRSETWDDMTPFNEYFRLVIGRWSGVTIPGSEEWSSSRGAEGTAG